LAEADITSDNDGELKFDESYSFIAGISDSDSEGSEADTDQNRELEADEISIDDFYNVVMDEIEDCLHAESNYDLKEDKETFDNLTEIKGTLCNGLREAKEAIEEVVEVVEQKWEVLSSDEWKEFSDETAVFNYINDKIREGLQAITSTEESEKDTKTEVEILLQV